MRAEGDEEGARRAEAKAAVSAVGGFIPGVGGLAPLENSASRLGVFVPAGEDKAGLARMLWQNMPRNYRQGTSPAQLNKSVYKETGVVFGPEGAAKQWIEDSGMSQPKIGAIGETKPLGEVIDHPALFKTEPWLADVPVTFRSATPEGGQAKYYAPFARTNNKTGGLEISTNIKPADLRGQLAKLISYKIGEEHGFAAPGRHSVSGNIDKLNETQEAIRQNLLSDKPAPGGLPYFDRLLKIQDKIAEADRAAETDPSAHPWLAESGEAGKPLAPEKAGKALSLAISNRMAGNVDAQLARRHLLHGDPGEFPYAGVNLQELFTLPQSNILSDKNALARWLEAWKTYGQGAPSGRSK